MNETVEKVCAALEELSFRVNKAMNAQRGDHKRSLTEIRGWNHPCLTGTNLTEWPYQLAKDLREANPQSISAPQLECLNQIPVQLKALHDETISHLFDGNSSVAIPAYTTSLLWVERCIKPLIDWQVIGDPKAMPAAMARRIRSFNVQLDNVIVDEAGLKEKIDRIDDAAAAAESLPVDLESLQSARESIQEYRTQSAADSEKITQLHQSATQGKEGISQYSAEQKQLIGELINGFKQKAEKSVKDAEKLIARCEEAYSITTTKGLAGAFEQRAQRLTRSVLFWVVGLVFALVAGFVIGTIRINQLTTALSADEPSSFVIGAQFLLSILSIGAPVWFAWLSTKQIGYLFRMSEDYAFKATVAKAYEGYRREAVRLDPEFELKLFASALNRLDEAPLRFVSTKQPATPLQDLLSPDERQEILDAAPPAIRAKLAKLLNWIKQKPTQKEPKSEE